tara:strand:+ start:43 stop:4383 length:4341 start_codon:yes stop_codon:yes gene_type:complete
MKYITFILSLFLSTLFYNSYSQSTLTVTVNGLEDGDSAKVTLTKGTYVLIVKKAKNPVDKKAEITFDSLSNGDNWVIAIDAPGYAYPTSAVIKIPDISSLTIDISKYSANNFIYEWQDDSSFVGHATQTYVNEPPTLVVLNDTLKIPNDYSSIKLREEYGFVLSNDIKEWSNEDSYRLYSKIERFKDIIGNAYGESSVLNYTTGENVRAIWYLTDQEILNDLSITIKDGIKHVTLASSSLTYAEPQVVTLDGIRGKFYSKRLYKAMLYYFSDFGNNAQILEKIANNRFGFRFMKSDQETEDLMNESASNFQEFYPNEKIEILGMFEEMPDGFHSLDCHNYLVRRIDGQPHPVLSLAPAIAWTSGVMEFMEKGFKDVSISYIRRLILHEKAHYLWQCYFDQKTKDDWATIGGWYEDPLSSTGWSTSKTTEFVSAYAHLKNPNEDMAESVSFYIENPDALRSRSMQKYEFIRDRVMHGTRYIAQIREDLTFTVYNLFPDYFYPGKIIGTKVEVIGASDENKTVKFTIKLKSDSVALDGASKAQTRFTSSIGTFYDVWLYPKNGIMDSVLTGEFTISKFAKSGYWKPSQIQVWDNVGNGRYENLNTVGVKAFVNNPLEDIIPPEYRSYKLDTVTALMSKNGNRYDSLSGNGILMKTLRLQVDFYDKNPMGRALARLQFPNTATYSKDTQKWPGDHNYWTIEDTVFNGFNSVKKYTLLWGIPDYFPSDYYSITYIDGEDIARNIGKVYINTDTAAFNDNPSKGLYKDLRDSIYIENQYPDYLAPLLDINKITIDAEPVNPVAPDGETKVEIRVLVKDTSNYFGKEASIASIYYYLRDPQGVDHEFRHYPGGIDRYYDQTADSAAYEWKYMTLNARLPKGSAPGKWGLSEVRIMDRAGNENKYSFVEFVRFDIIKSDIVLTEPLYAEITGKLVNAYNVDSISAFITCSPCSELKYNYTIYSLMGGIVKTGEKVMGSDSVYVTDLDVSGIPDGVIKLTVQLKDTLDQLVATTTTDYTKDVIFPSSYYFQSNLQNFGSSNIDSLTITINTVEVNGEYELTVEGLDTIGGGINIEDIDIGIESEEILLENQLDDLEDIRYDNNPVIIRVRYTGGITNNNLDISNIDLNQFADGPIFINMVVTDSALNIGTEIFTDTIYKDLPDAPISVDIDSLITDEDEELDIILSATDPDGDSLTYLIVNQPINGTVVFSESVARYTPNIDFYGLDSLTYKASDGILESNISEVSITVSSIYDKPNISLISNNSSIDEENGSSEITATAEGVDAGDEEVTIILSTSGTASSSDYILSEQSISILKGDINGKIILTPVNDTEYETSETIIIDIDSIVNGKSDGSQQMTITILESDKPLYLENTSFINLIYPNPVDSDLIVELKKGSKFEDIEFIDFSGKRIKPFNTIQKGESIHINVSNLLDGIYILNIATDKGLNKVKILIER